MKTLEKLKQFRLTALFPTPAKGIILDIRYPRKDIYNPSVPFEFNGNTYIICRVESRNSETDSQAIYFRRNNDNSWTPVKDAPYFNLQDPFVTVLEDKFLLGGVEVDWNTGIYRTVFYYGNDPFNLQLLFTGPDGMKDIRVVSGYGVFTRPQQGVYGPGKIGWMSATNVNQLVSLDLTQATMLPDHFGSSTWGGVNQAFRLENGLIGCIGHWARFVGKNRKYIGISFEYDPVNNSSSEYKIIAQRNDFPKTPTKRKDLYDVIFPAGIYFKEKWFLVAGLSDASIGEIEIEYPFSSKII